MIDSWIKFTSAWGYLRAISSILRCSTIFRIRDYWIPLIHSTMSAEQQKMPLILVGNKSDTDEISVLIDSVLSIMNDFPEVGRERDYVNVRQMLHRAHTVTTVSSSLLGKNSLFKFAYICLFSGGNVHRMLGEKLKEHLGNVLLRSKGKLLRV